ncbi:MULTISPECIES: glycosyltransferase family 2 protein [unclassified Mesorhizobium]|uniref:glycosyltransferase family 2 protein n=1 Tax=unclassified Mesorhizobium TaxID=325217 RepID=UPI000A7D87CA|nr:MULTISPECIES: glycosyltransferase family 2 protein [unclassified Mesorhizobium]MBN9254668.1 glycosyltransferase [Mesorhizobium sp.]
MIIPAHDAAGTIAATIASLASEVDIIAEILVVDDGSSDDTADFAEKAGRDHGLPVTITRIGRLNAGAARNAGMALAAAPWLYFLDADDLHLEGGLRCLLRQALQAGNTDLVLGGYIRKLEGTVRTIDAADGYGISCMDNAENYLIDRRETINIGSALIRASAVADKTFAETLPYEEDTLFWARLLTKSPVAKVGRAVMAYNISRDRSDERLMVSPVSRFFAWRRALRELAKFDIRETILRRREGLVAIKIARVHCRRGDFRMARKFLLLAWPAPKDLRTRWRYWRYRIKVFWKFA